MNINSKVYEILVTNEPNQHFRCTIPIDGENRTFILDLKYNSEAEYWIMALTDDLTNKILLDSIPLLAGIYPAGNILEQYTYLNIGSMYIAKTNPDITDENPNAETLGNGFKLT